MKYTTLFLWALTLIFLVGCAPKIEASEKPPIPADEINDVVIITNKANYQTGDTLSISVTNNNDKDITVRIFGGELDIFKFDGFTWKYHGVPTRGCPCGAICEPLVEEIVVGPKQTVKLPLSLPLQIETCTEDNQLLVQPLEKGRYKTRLYVHPAPSPGYGETTSNEFSVTE